MTLSVTLAACGGSKPSPSSAPTPPISPSVSSAETDAKSKALAAYKGFIDTYNKDSLTANYEDPDLRKYLGDPLLTTVQSDLQQMSKGGLVRTGQLGSTPEVTAVNVSGQPKTVTIGDCLDTSDWHTINKVTGASVDAPGQPTRRKITAEAELYDDGRWLIHESSTIAGAVC